MRLVLTAIATALTLAAPAQAQLHERGVVRSGAVQETTMGGTALMCRLACSLRGGCTGWSWTRAGVEGPQARCQLLSGPLQSRPDGCCDSGQLTGVAAPVAAGPAFGENRYAGRSTAPEGAPVSLTSDPTGGIWEDSNDQSEEETEDDVEDDAPMTAEEEDDARFAAQENIEAPQATATPSARIVSSGPRTGGGPPRYSVQREYEAAPAAPVEQPAAGVADPGRWIEG